MGVSVTGIEALRGQLARARDRASNLAPFLQEEAAAINDLITRAWSGRRSPGGERWAPSSSDGGSLRTAHRVTAGPRTLVLDVAHPAARFQFFGTRTVPARNPLPIERDGAGYRPIRTGKAGRFWREHAERLGAYLAGAEEGAST